MVALREREQTVVKTPLEKMLASFPALREKGNGNWAHENNPRFDCKETEDGTILINPWTGRSPEAVLAMGIPPRTMTDLYKNGSQSKSRFRKRDQLDLLALSHYLLIDHQFLASLGYEDGYTYVNTKGQKTVCVKLGEYCAPDGTPHSKNRVRLSIDGKLRFLWDQNTPGTPIPCGLHRLDVARQAGFLFVGEGESDYVTMRFHGMPFLGIPGADAVKHLDVSLLEGIPTIYIIEEPDQAQKNGETGKGFYANMRSHLRDQGYTGDIFSIRWKDATGFKDPSSLHKAMYRDVQVDEEVPFRAEVMKRFADALVAAMEQAISEGNEGLADQEDVPADELPPPPTDANERMAWFSQLCAVPSTILSPSQKITLMVVLTHAQWWSPDIGWWKVDADFLAKQAGMSKEIFLSNLAYLSKKVPLFEKKHERIWYTDESSQQKRCSTELYIQPSPDVWITYPSTYQLAEGVEERKHGGMQTPKPKCEKCGSEELETVHLCRNCQHVQPITLPPQEEQEHPEEQIESTAVVLPMEEEKPPIIGNLPLIESEDTYNRQLAPYGNAESEERQLAPYGEDLLIPINASALLPSIERAETPPDRFDLVIASGFTLEQVADALQRLLQSHEIIASENDTYTLAPPPLTLPPRMTYCCNMPFQLGPHGPECSNPACPEKRKAVQA